MLPTLLSLENCLVMTQCLTLTIVFAQVPTLGCSPEWEFCLDCPLLGTFWHPLYTLASITRTVSPAASELLFLSLGFACFCPDSLSLRSLKTLFTSPLEYSFPVAESLSSQFEWSYLLIFAFLA